MSDTFTVFGLQRSGTNFLQQLITRNIRNTKIANTWRAGDGIWKHAFGIENKPTDAGPIGMKGDPEKAKMIGGRIHSIYIHKHPYSWIESITTKKVDIKKTYPFVTNELDQKANVLNGLNILHLAQLYHDHTRYWLDKVETRKVYHVKYEDLIFSPEKTKEIVTDIAQFFNRKLKETNIIIPDKVGQSDTFNEEKRKRYRNYQITSLSYEQIHQINLILDRDAMAKQGYSMIETEEEYQKHKK